MSLHSVQFSRSVVSNSLQSHEPQHSGPPCPSPTPGVHPNPCPLSRWCHPTISSSVIPFSSCLQSFPASGSFPMSQLFTSGSQSIRVSASTSVLPSPEHPGLISSRMDWLDLLAVQGTLKSLLQLHTSKVWTVVLQAPLCMGILQLRILEWVAMLSSRVSSQPRSPTWQVDSLPSDPPEKPKNTEVSSLSLLQGIFPTQGLNPGLQHCRQTLYYLSHQGSHNFKLFSVV